MLPDDHEQTPLVAEPRAPLPDAVYRMDHTWHVSHVNFGVETILDRPAAEIVGRHVLDAFPGVRGTLVEESLGGVLEDGQPRVFRYHHKPWDHFFEFRVYPDSQGVTIAVRDIDERLRAEAARDAQTVQLNAVLETLPSATVLVEGDGTILTANRAWVGNGELLRSTGLVPGGVGDNYLECMSRGLDPADHAAIVAGVQRLTAPEAPATGTFEYEYSSRLGGFTAWFQLQAARVADSRRLVITHSDVTARVRGEQALAWQATHDELTGLANRAALLRLIGAALDTHESERTALLVIDLDGFKTVNDSLGHQLADALLCQVAGRLVEQVRPGDAVGRLGGDQFVVLARDCDSAEAAALGFRLQSSFATPFDSSGIVVPLSASIGVATARNGSRDAHQLLSDADAAMFAAKSSGRDRVHLFSPALREAARWRLEVASRLREDAVQQLVLHYQPIVRLDTGAVEGVEALVRWQHPERGLLAPDAFLRIAEETGQIIPITRWLLGEATSRAAQWAAAGLPLRMSVNVSARHFATETLVHDVRGALRASGLPADQLVLELTETSLAEDPSRAEDQLSLLRSHGVRVAIDDFGTGWSSLAQLFALPIGTLKIDRSLLTAAEEAVAGETGAVLAAIVGLTRTLGLRSVAEGVETAEHLRMVRAAGCDLAQGYLLGMPMPADELTGWLRAVQEAGGDLCTLATSGAGIGQRV